MYAVTANTGVGKSKFTKHLFVKKPYDFVKNNPKTGLKLRIIYFALEESVASFEDNIMVMRLAEKHGIYKGISYLRSYKKEYLSEEILDLLEADEEWRQEFLDHVDVVEEDNPTGMWKHCKKLADELGVTQPKMVKVKKFLPDGSHKYVIEQRGTEYIPNDPDMYVIVVVDHINLIKPEKAPKYRTQEGKTPRVLSKHETIERWVTDYARNVLCKKWGWSVVNVIQQSAESEKQQYSKSGGSIAAKVEPSLEGFGNNKEIQRDHDVILGLFNPHRYKIPEVQGWDIRKVRDYYRQVSILKNRIGEDYKKVSLFFEGATGTFKEMPSSKDEHIRDKYYAEVSKFKKMKKPGSIDD